MRRAGQWLQVKVTTSVEAAEAVSQALLDQGASGVVLDALATRTAYFPCDVAPADETLASIRSFLDRLPQWGLDPGPAQIEWRLVAEEDWADAWKAYFRPLHIGERVVIRPTWHAYTPAPHEIVIDLDPGMAFGTGLHPTTRLCIAQIERHLRPGALVFDVGTGSGILSIVAARLGAARVAAVDIDPLAVSVARENVAANGVDEIVSVAVGGWTSFPEALRADFVVANIIAEVIAEMAPDLSRLVQPDGLFVASGIIESKRQAVEEALAGSGWRVVDADVEGEWVVLVCRHQGGEGR